MNQYTRPFSPQLIDKAGKWLARNVGPTEVHRRLKEYIQAGRLPDQAAPAIRTISCWKTRPYGYKSRHLAILEHGSPSRTSVT